MGRAHAQPPLADEGVETALIGGLPCQQWRISATERTSTRLPDRPEPENHQHLLISWDGSSRGTPAVSWHEACCRHGVSLFKRSAHMACPICLEFLLPAALTIVVAFLFATVL